MREVLSLRELGGDDVEPGGVVAGESGGVVAPDGAEGVAEPAEMSVATRGWRAQAAAGVVIALFLGVGYMLTAGRPPRVDRAGVALVPGDPVEDAARAALDAWARFADAGDVDALGAAFDRSGPQFARLRAEAPAVAARPAAGARYVFAAAGMRVGAGGREDERVVAADVVVSRVGETDQRFAWELVMRRSEGRWRLWTVRDRTAAGS